MTYNKLSIYTRLCHISMGTSFIGHKHPPLPHIHLIVPPSQYLYILNSCHILNLKAGFDQYIKILS